MKRRFSNINKPLLNPLVDGEYPPAERIEMLSIPCKCGIIHEEGDGNYERYDIKICDDESIPPMQAYRCNTCKETLLLQRHVVKDEV